MDDGLFGSDEDLPVGCEERDEERDANNGVLSFHNGTEEAMFIYINNRMKTDNYSGDSTHDHVASILSLCDEFCMRRHWMMHVGPEKANILKDAFKMLPRSSSVYVLELGSYCGYSSALIADMLFRRDKALVKDTERVNRSHSNGSSSISSSSSSRKRTKSHLVSIEPDPKCVRWTNRMLSSSFCNLSSYSTVLETAVTEREKNDEVNPDFLAQLDLLQRNWNEDENENEGGGRLKFDLLFIDHDKSKYLVDLIVLQDSNLLNENCVVVADNVLSFGQPLTEYLDYVRGNKAFASSDLFISELEYSQQQALQDARGKQYFVDGVEVSILV